MNCNVKWAIFAVKEYAKSHSTIDTDMTVDELIKDTCGEMLSEEIQI